MAVIYQAGKLLVGAQAFANINRGVQQINTQDGRHELTNTNDWHNITGSLSCASECPRISLCMASYASSVFYMNPLCCSAFMIASSSSMALLFGGGASPVSM